MPKIKIHDVSSGEIIEREMDEDELKVAESAEAIFKEEMAQNLAKEKARQAILDKLGITEDEARLLLGGN